ncbi:MAG: zinc-ribbon domain-containing protein [Armatimonadetes bacterium]|nr:zinc-ribbon domain-containing protein [Armatimonadota bacterium]
MAEDQVLTCRDCGAEYVFTSGEQEFFAEREFTPPTRCPACRRARKASRSADSGNFREQRPERNSSGGNRQRRY